MPPVLLLDFLTAECCLEAKCVWQLLIALPRLGRLNLTPHLHCMYGSSLAVSASNTVKFSLTSVCFSMSIRNISHGDGWRPGSSPSVASEAVSGLRYIFARPTLSAYAFLCLRLAQWFLMKMVVPRGFSHFVLTVWSGAGDAQ